MIKARTLQNTKSSAERDDLLQTAQEELHRERGRRFADDWKEDVRGAARVQNLHNKQMRQEVKMANKELVLIRRAALLHLLQEEHQQHQAELSRQGRTFYRQRL